MKRTILATIILSVLIGPMVSCGPRGGKKGTDAQSDSLKTALEMEKKMMEEPEFEIVTTHGTMKLKLYSKTPKHRDNFVKLVKEKYSRRETLIQGIPP